MQTPPTPPTPEKRIPLDQMDDLLAAFEPRGPAEITPIVSFKPLMVVSEEDGTAVAPFKAPVYPVSQAATHAPAKAHHAAKSKEMTQKAHSATSQTVGSSSALKHHEAKTAHEVAAHHAKMAGHHELSRHHSAMASHHGEIYRALGDLHDRHATFHQHNPHLKGEGTEVDITRGQWENQQRFGKERFAGLCVSGRAKATSSEDLEAFTDCSVLEANRIDYSDISPEVWASLEEMAKLGSGARFKALQAKIARKGGVRNPAAVAAAIGRKKFGKARFQKLAAAGHHEEVELTQEDVSAAAHRASTHTTMVHTSDAHTRAQKLHLKAAKIAHESGNKKLAQQHRDLASGHATTAATMKAKGL